MQHRRHLIAAMLAAGTLWALPHAGSEAAGVALGREGHARWGLLEQYCNECHNTSDWAGGIAFDTLSVEGVAGEAQTWERAVQRLRGRMMPPPGSPQPAQSEIDGFVKWLESSLDAGRGTPRAGHVPVQRLSRGEYANVVRNLLGVQIQAADLLPPEMKIDGFENIAAALSTSPSFLSQYMTAARLIAARAVGDAAPRAQVVFHPMAPVPAGVALPPGTRGGMSFRHHFPADGEYRVTIRDLDVGLYLGGVETRQAVVVLVAGREVFRGDIGGPEDLAVADRKGADGRAAIMSRFADIPVMATAGEHEVLVTFIERSRAETDETVNDGGGFGGLRQARLLDGVEIAGPFNPTGLSRNASRERIFVCEPGTAAEEAPCARRIAQHLARRAFRRPVDASDIDRLMPFYEAGRGEPGGFDTGVAHLVTAVLASPDFLYRAIAVEPASGQQPRRLDDLELASRLSFFLWAQGPDDELIDLAARGRLSRPPVLRAQVDRMLSDPRALSLVTGFALKWLHLEDLEVVVPDTRLFPEFNAGLRAEFAREMELFLKDVLLGGKSVVRLLDSKTTFVNERLARHYGIEGVRGTQFRPVALADERRLGILGKGAMLLRTSYGDRTSPVLRGAWVLEKLMGTPPTPPPPDVETDLSAASGAVPTTIRARLEQHRSAPGCNSCHGVIDPLGIALENFSVTGQWRDVDAQARQPIDAATVLPNGRTVSGPAQLREELLQRPEQFVQAMTEKLLMYAVGRQVRFHDMPQVRAIVRNASKKDYTFASLVHGIVTSDAFLLQAGPQPSTGADAVAASRP